MAWSILAGTKPCGEATEIETRDAIPGGSEVEEKKNMRKVRLARVVGALILVAVCFISWKVVPEWLRRKQHAEFCRAAGNGDIEKVKEFIAQGVDVNYVPKPIPAVFRMRRRGVWVTPLHYAAYESAPKTLEVAKVLLDNGANVNAQGYGPGDTPLDRAIRYFRSPTMGDEYTRLYKSKVRLLIDRGADARYMSGGGRSALAVAVQSGDREVFDMVMGLNIEDRQKDSALVEAIRSGREDYVQSLLEDGAPANPSSARLGTTPLHEAVAVDHLRIVQLLLAHGAEVNALKHDVWSRKTPLDIATDERIAAELKLHGAVGATAK